MDRRTLLLGALAAPALMATPAFSQATAQRVSRVILRAPDQSIIDQGSYTLIPQNGANNSGGISYTPNSGPDVRALFGSRAITEMINAESGLIFGVRFTIDGADPVRTIWRVRSVVDDFAQADIEVDGQTYQGTATADTSQFPGQTLAALIASVISGAALQAGHPATSLRARIGHANGAGQAQFRLNAAVETV
ncbi:hypothetical protein [Gymnodinialimonas hymeniacidonis]|uniref:hypothetical protein n=1 Tax=Gymnodinialimonas hymeniacidonis TaxID=3126508 RepID=UPI0034C60522